jgi:hypothetical protein
LHAGGFVVLIGSRDEAPKQWQDYWLDGVDAAVFLKGVTPSDQNEAAAGSAATGRAVWLPLQCGCSLTLLCMAAVSLKGVTPSDQFEAAAVWQQLRLVAVSGTLQACCSNYAYDLQQYARV